MSTITRKLTLVGPHEGKTISFKVGTKEYPFTEGSMDLTGPSQDVDNLSKYLRRCFEAYPDPSRELDDARAALRGDDHAGEADQAEPGPGDEHPGGADDDEGGAGAAPGEQPGADDIGGADGPEAGEAGAGDAPGDGQGPVAAALKRLDPNNDEHWTADGKPAMRAVEAILGRSDVTRSDVSAALPGFDREAARG